jgi:uncharacterized protein YndB with AHSA1/START domain
MTDEKTLVIDRLFNASPDRMFAAWTETAQLTQWYGPEGMTAEIFENDVTPGGPYALVMRSEEGEYHLSGNYEEIDPPHRLVITWKWKTSEETTRVTIELSPEGDKTHLRLTHTGFAEADQTSSHNQGWTSLLNDLERYLAA